MKKCTFAFCVVTAFVFGALCAEANVLSPEQALTRVMNSPQSKNKVRAIDSTGTPELVYTHSDNGLASVYVFSTKNTGEYMVLPADDIAPALLGYGDNFEELNPTMQWWLEEYGRQIQWGRENGVMLCSASMPSSQYPAITPKVKTKWNQSAPFNNSCPLYNNQRCVTGCVATALAQIMNYHQWPVKGTGSYSYTTKTYGLSCSFNFGDTTFDWSNMLDVYGSTATATQQNAVATLMYACGVASQMNYTLSASGANSLVAATGMINYLGYDKGIVDYYRDYYSLDDWNKLVYNQLVDYGPVQYSGQSNSGGHSFVCDGYSSDGYFHINWGWGGMSDGYFLLTALNPTSQGIGGSTSGYNFSQDVIGNVKKSDGSNSSIVPNMLAQSYVPENTTYTKGSSILFNSFTVNYSVGEISGTLGIKAVSASGQETFIGGQSFTNLEQGYGYRQYYVYTSSMNLANGTYTISPALRTTDGTIYDIPVKIGAEKATTMTISGNTISFATEAPASIQVSNLTAKSSFYVGTDFMLSATVANNSEQEYTGLIYLVLANSSGNIIGEAGNYPVDLMPGESVDIDYLSSFLATTSTAITAGNYLIAFMDASGNQVSSAMQITMGAKPATATVSITDLRTLLNPAPREEIQFTGTVKVTGGYLAGPLRIYIFPGKGGTSLTSASTNPLFLGPGETGTLTCTISYPDGVIGSTYFATVYFDSKWVSNDTYFTLAEGTTAVDDIEYEAQPAKVEYFSINGMLVGELSSAPAGVYIVRKTMNDGTVKTEKFIKK